jgi:hypothetical protein
MIGESFEFQELLEETQQLIEERLNILDEIEDPEFECSE